MGHSINGVVGRTHCNSAQLSMREPSSEEDRPDGLARLNVLEPLDHFGLPL